MVSASQPPLEVWSIGYIASQLRMSVNRTAGCLAVLGHKPCLTVNGVAHFDTDAYLAMMEFAQREDKAESQRSIRLHG